MTGETVALADMAPLVAALRADGYRVIGPTVRDGAIVLSELESAAELPYGWGVDTAPGRYRLRRRTDGAAFGHAAGPQAWKRFLHPPREQVLSARRTATGVELEAPTEAVERFALLGVRPCDLRAIAVQDRVLADSQRYAARRAAALVIAVDCTEPATTCFCVSAGGGPGAIAGYDMAITELADREPPRFLLRAATVGGERMLAALPHEPASPGDIERGRAAVRAAADRMGRVLPPSDLRALLAASAESPRWADVATRCLACANCTMACPTCFCTSVEDATDLSGDHAQRWEHWASCFDLDFSYLHGGPVRTSVRSRYRQWLTHKIGTWHDQFGESGCVGCGRCIAWCPVGIDITEELWALSEEAEAAT